MDNDCYMNKSDTDIVSIIKPNATRLLVAGNARRRRLTLCCVVNHKCHIYCCINACVDASLKLLSVCLPVVHPLLPGACLGCRYNVKQYSRYVHCVCN